MTFARNACKIAPLLSMIALKNQAIQTALNGDWNQAIILNLELLKEDPKNIETLNRIAFAYSVLGKNKDAKSFYQKVLQLDSQNPIALKNLKRLSSNSKSDGTTHTLMHGKIDTLFLEEGGKTKVIELINIAESKIVSHLMTGEALTMKIKRLKLFVYDSNNQYIGMLPDDIGKRLIKFINGGNSYELYSKSVQNRHIWVFIKETKRVSRFKNQPSFSPYEKHRVNFSSKNYSKDDEDSSMDE